MGKITDALTKVEKERRGLPTQVAPSPEPAKTKRRSGGPVFLWVGLALLGGLVFLYAFGRAGQRSSNEPPASLPPIQFPQAERTTVKREAAGGEGAALSREDGFLMGDEFGVDGSNRGRLDERTEIILAATFLVLIILAFIR